MSKLKRSGSLPLKKSPSKLKRSASMPGKKYTNPRLAKIFTLPIEIQCEIFKTIDLDDLNNVILANQTLKRNILSCVENVVIKNDNSDLKVLLQLKRLKHIAHRNDRLYLYVNKAIRDKDYKMLELLLKYGRFSKEGPCYSCDFLNDLRALKLGLKYNKADITYELKHAITHEEYNDVSYIRFLLKYAEQNNVPINYTSIIRRAQKTRDRDLINYLIKHQNKHGERLNTVPKDYWKYHDQSGILHADAEFLDAFNPNL